MITLTVIVGVHEPISGTATVPQSLRTIRGAPALVITGTVSGARCTSREYTYRQIPARRNRSRLHIRDMETTRSADIVPAGKPGQSLPSVTGPGRIIADDPQISYEGSSSCG